MFITFTYLSVARVLRKSTAFLFVCFLMRNISSTTFVSVFKCEKQTSDYFVNSNSDESHRPLLRLDSDVPPLHGYWLLRREILDGTANQKAGSGACQNTDETRRTQKEKKTMQCWLEFLVFPACTRNTLASDSG